ncbi:MAG: histidine--tRNA ligase [Candidatus Aenigmarchaeota archaeon]|nr:histidine--tRNA ligase [Candidatus Aenigmarchaeota archaeon]
MKKVKGMRDFDSCLMSDKDFIVKKIEEVFSSFNFRKIDTPVMEYFDTLTKQGTGGDEIENQTYNFYDFSKRRIGLRYDLTVPLARYLSENSNFAIPQKLQRIGKVWRYEDTKKGRYREFSQYDVDIVGSLDMTADAQILFCAYCALKNTGLSGFTFQINNRKLTDGMLEYLGVKGDKLKTGVMRTIDKLEKLSRDELYREFEKYNIKKTKADKILDCFELKGSVNGVLKSIKEKYSFENNETASEGLVELEKLGEYLSSYGMNKVCEYNLSIVRGLDYYTGCVFETKIKGERQLGSICSGGRYDKMLGSFMNKDVPCTGISIGVDRLLDYFVSKKKEENKLMNKNAIFVASADVQYSNRAIELAAILRDKLKSKDAIIETDVTGRKLASQIKYADREKIRYVIIVGKDIDNLKKVTFKDMEKHCEKQVSADLKGIEKMIE